MLQLFVVTSRSFIFLDLFGLWKPACGGPAEKQPDELHRRSFKIPGLKKEAEPEPAEQNHQKRFSLLRRRRSPSTTSATPTAPLLPLLARRLTASTRPSTVLQQEVGEKQACKNKHECVDKNVDVDDREAEEEDEEEKDRKETTKKGKWARLRKARLKKTRKDLQKGNGEPAPAESNPNPPVWPKTVLVFHPDSDCPGVGCPEKKQKILDNIWYHGAAGDTSAQFAPVRRALLFLPGAHKVDVSVGYYHHVLGLGRGRLHTKIGKVQSVDTGGVFGTNSVCNGGALCNFWRLAENFHTPNDLTWHTSQGCALRRTFSHSLTLAGEGYSSGGFVADALVGSELNLASQQQFSFAFATCAGWAGGVTARRPAARGILCTSARPRWRRQSTKVR